MTVRPK